MPVGNSFNATVMVSVSGWILSFVTLYVILFVEPIIKLPVNELLSTSAEVIPVIVYGILVPIGNVFSSVLRDNVNCSPSLTVVLFDDNLYFIFPVLFFFRYSGEAISFFGVSL